MSRLLDSLLFPFAVFGVLCLTALLLGCAPQQQQQITPYQQQIEAACGVAMTLAPIAGPYAPWIIGGCATSEAILKLASDPNSFVWLEDLMNKAKANGSSG